MKRLFMIVAGVALAAILFWKRKKIVEQIQKGGTMIGGMLSQVLNFVNPVPFYWNSLKEFFIKEEGFRSVPYWDYKQWSWGFGTKVPGSTENKLINPGGSISEEEAMKQSSDHVAKDYEVLKNVLKVDLTTEQWTALLSFSYNLGVGSALKLVPLINDGKMSDLRSKWLSYVNAGGVKNEGLVKRRNNEWKLFIS